jgi:putative ABC transport system substrate-binding protein
MRQERAAGARHAGGDRPPARRPEPLRLRIWLCLALLAAAAVSAGCRRAQEARPASGSAKPKLIGIFQSVDSPTANEVRRGLLQAFEDRGLREGENIQVRIRIAAGDLSEVQRIAHEFEAEKVDLIVPLSTQCLQAALIAGRRAPIVFSSVATPFLVGAGKSATDHLPFVTGVASTGPIRQTVDFIHRVLPRAKRIGTLWTPRQGRGRRPRPGHRGRPGGRCP